MRTKLQITPSTDLERRLSAVQHRKLQLQLPHGLTIVYLVGSLLCTCLYFVEFLAFLPNVTTTMGMVIFMGLAIVAAWALNHYNHQAAVQWKQQTHDQIAAELLAQRLTYPDINIAELNQLLNKLNMQMIRTSDNITTPLAGAIESAVKIVNLENTGPGRLFAENTNKQIDPTDDPLTKFKPGWYVLRRFDAQQQAFDYRLSDPVPVKTIDQLVDIVVRILLSKVKFKRVRLAKH